MHLTFLGGADEVGASSTLVEVSGKLLLVDAGIRISPHTNRGIRDDQLPDLHPISEAGGPDYILVTHAHTDHTGALPLVVEQYPHAPVLAARPTVELVRVLQADAQRIMQARHEQEGELPLFDEVAVGRLMNAFQPVDFGQPVRLGEGLQVTYHPAGHILGAALLVIESQAGTLVMSGDLSLSNQRAVVKAKLPRLKADALVLESTYGGRLHANRRAEELRLVESLQSVIERGGKALIPAFAIGRAQEVLQIILAFRDQLPVPVYVDGMVRAVCRAYTRFYDWLPPATVRAAGERELFFREKIRQVQSAAQREEVARAEGPAIIVASSGMLTGGASVVYAKHLAPDERSAILLTGYQDEEAPGRRLQRLMQRRQAGEEAAFEIDGQKVTLRCQVDSYSLSAHADEAQLVSVAEALQAGRVMLVHGDPAARHSLASALRERQRVVRLPRVGEKLSFAFERRAWAVGSLPGGGHSRPLEAAQLWQALKAEAGNYYSARELALAWWGEAERAPEAAAALAEDGVYFSADWRRADTFRVNTPQQVERARKRRAIMLAYPDLVGQLIVLRDSNGRPRLGVVSEADVDSFEATVLKAKGRRYPADALLWALGPWQGPPEGRPLLARLNAIFRQAKALQSSLLPFEQRQALVAAGQPVQPPDLLPEQLPPDTPPQVALLAVVLALAEGGATLEEGGLLPRHALDEEPLEMNLARETALAAFPPQARLRKVGLEDAFKRMTLVFDFPQRAVEQYAELIERVAEQTGWQVTVNPSPNQQALGLAVSELLPPGARLSQGPSFYMERGEVHVQLDGLADPQALAAAYHDLTGFRLVVNQPGVPPLAAPPGLAGQMEINAAYALIREELEPHGLYKTSFKQGGIVLSFISPQLGARHQAAIDRLAQATGYPLSVHPHPNQNAILQLAAQLARQAGWSVRKGPGLRVERAEVTLSLAEQPDPASVEQVGQVLEQETGYRLVLEG